MNKVSRMMVGECVWCVLSTEWLESDDDSFLLRLIPLVLRSLRGMLTLDSGASWLPSKGATGEPTCPSNKAKEKYGYKESTDDEGITEGVL